MSVAPQQIDSWPYFQEFMAGFAAAAELRTRAAKNGCFVECVCLTASIIDAQLRVGLVLKHQLDNLTRDIPIDLIFQDVADKAIPEREIYRRALASEVICNDLFSLINALYGDRNRVIPRYVISRITTSEVLDIAQRYEGAMHSVSKAIYALEERQIALGVGITVSGPSAERQLIDSFADFKHTPALGALLRDS